MFLGLSFPLESQGKQDNGQEEIYANLEKLMDRIQNLEERYRIENLEERYRIEHLEERLSFLENPRYMEDDIKQNQEDIIELRMTDGIFEHLISKNMHQIKNITVMHEEDVVRIEDETNTLREDMEDMIKEFEYLKEVQIPPIGSIIAWLPTLAPSIGEHLPLGWVRCNGLPIVEGPLAGTLTPDLNSAKRFLRGGRDENAGSMEEDTVMNHLHDDLGHTHVVNYL